MELGARDAMANGLTKMLQRQYLQAQQLLQKVSALRVPPLREAVRRASQALRHAFEKARQLLRRALPAPLQQLEFAQRLQQFLPVRHLPRLRNKLIREAPVQQARQLLQRLQQLFQSVRQQSLPGQLFPRSVEKFRTALEVSRLSLQLALVASSNGFHKVARRLAGAIKDRLQTLGQLNPLQVMRGASNRLLLRLGQIKQTLRQVGRKLHRS